MRKTFFLFMTFTLVSAGCAARRADLEAPVQPGNLPQKVVVVKGVGYDQYGLPKFGAVLKDRPTEPGEQFTLVYEVNNRPVKSFEIAVIGERKPDIAKPIKVLFEWTGKGFIVGASMVYGTGPVHFSYDAKTNMVYTTASLAPVVVMATGGFIVGVVAGMVSAGEELRCAVIGPRELVLSSTVYEYDQQGRLKRLRMFLPDEKTEVVRTEYVYADGELVPGKAESRSYPEDTVRTIGK